MVAKILYTDPTVKTYNLKQYAVVCFLLIYIPSIPVTSRVITMPLSFAEC